MNIKVNFRRVSRIIDTSMTDNKADFAKEVMKIIYNIILEDTEDDTYTNRAYQAIVDIDEIRDEKYHDSTTYATIYRVKFTWEEQEYAYYLKRCLDGEFRTINKQLIKSRQYSTKVDSILDYDLSKSAEYNLSILKLDGEDYSDKIIKLTEKVIKSCDISALHELSELDAYTYNLSLYLRRMVEKLSRLKSLDVKKIDEKLIKESQLSPIYFELSCGYRINGYDFLICKYTLYSMNMSIMNLITDKELPHFISTQGKYLEVA